MRAIFSFFLSSIVVISFSTIVSEAFAQQRQPGNQAPNLQPNTPFHYSLPQQVPRGAPLAWALPIEQVVKQDVQKGNQNNPNLRNIPMVYGNYLTVDWRSSQSIAIYLFYVQLAAPDKSPDVVHGLFNRRYEALFADHQANGRLWNNVFSGVANAANLGRRVNFIFDAVERQVGPQPIDIEARRLWNRHGNPTTFGNLR